MRVMMLNLLSSFSVTLYGVFTNHSCMGVATRCLLLELLDVSVSDLLVRGSSGTQGSRQVQLYTVTLSVSHWYGLHW